MIRLRAPLAAIACGFAFIFATPTLAQGPQAIPVTFDLSASTCLQLPAGTTIHGVGTMMVFATGNGNIHSIITGTATDGAGGFWRFNYSDNVRPLGDGPVEVTDHFSLVGSGSPIKVHSHFVADFSSSNLETADLLALKQIHGDPIGCDPI
jgi:hypothetical protein